MGYVCGQGRFDSQRGKGTMARKHLLMFHAALGDAFRLRCMQRNGTSDVPFTIPDSCSRFCKLNSTSTLLRLST